MTNIHVGEPTADFQFPHEENILVHFHNFVNLPHAKGEWVISPTFTSAGFEWHLVLFPGGHFHAKNGYISIFLCSNEPTKILDFDIILKPESNRTKLVTGAHSLISNLSKGCFDYARRNPLLKESNKILFNGTLTFEVRIQPLNNYRALKPRSTLLAENIFNLFGDEESADIAFEVKGKVFYAHKLILKSQAPDLAELVEQYDKSIPIPIKDVEPEIFQIILRFVYGKDVAADKQKESAKQILDASEKYGVTDLKLESEAWYVKTLEGNFTVETVVDELLYADGKNCELLKKAAMNFILENGDEVLESESYERLDASPKLRKEVMKAFSSSRKRKRDD